MEATPAMPILARAHAPASELQWPSPRLTSPLPPVATRKGFLHAARAASHDPAAADWRGCQLAHASRWSVTDATACAFGVTAALTLSASVLAGRLGLRRRTSSRHPVAVACAGTEDATSAPPKRRRRRKRRAVSVEEGEEEEGQMELTSDFVFKAQPTGACDCELILDTVVEIENILTVSECERLIGAARRRAAKFGWGQEQHAGYKTDDVKIWNLESATCLSIYTSKLVEPMREVIAEQFQLPYEAVAVDDGFIVRYTCEEDLAQTSLKYHRDGSIVSAIVTLSPSSDYDGGGTIFSDDQSTYRPKQGGCIIFAGQRLHAGVEITGGTRYICTLFFKCGELSCRDAALNRDTGGGADLLNLLGIN